MNYPALLQAKLPNSTMTCGISKGLKLASPSPTVSVQQTLVDFTRYGATEQGLHRDPLSAGRHESNSSKYSEKSQVASIPALTEGVLGDRRREKEMDKPHLPPTDFKKIDFAKLDKELKSWGFISLGIEELWEKKKVRGEGIPVGILDTGKPKHKDIVVKKSINLTDEKDDKDKNGHSTWVAGTVKADNPLGGLLGIAPKCELLTAKILRNDGGGEWEWLRRGLDWAYQEGCQVINVSAGGNIDDANRKRIEPLLKKMAGDGVLVVCAAGNERNIHIYPANSYYTICVGAVNRAIEKALFSNFGPRMLMMAPGVDLIGCWLNNEYRSASGTSMASPFGTGVLTLAKGLRRSLNLTEAIAWLALTSHDLQKPGWDIDTGFGYLHPKGFLNFTAKEKRLTGAWLVNFAIFVIAYLIGDEEYKTQAGRMLWPKRFLRFW